MSNNRDMERLHKVINLIGFVGILGTMLILAGNVFSGDQIIVNAINHAMGQGGVGSFCSTNGALWAVSIGLKSSGSWCIDSLGVAKQSLGIPSASIAGNICL